MDKPFWEKTYQNDDVATFGKSPTRDIESMCEGFNKSWSILDVGCGEGRNSIFLAERGFTVDAFDISEAGITKLLKIAAKRNVKLNAWVQDLTGFRFSKAYDVVLSHGVLHLVEREQWLKFITHMKMNTNVGGLNIIGVFTDRLPATPDNAPFTKGLFHEGELKSLYGDWNVVNSRSYEFEDEHPGGIRHRHAADNVIARKISE